MDCNRAGELLRAYLRSELPRSTRAEVQEHLDRCASCRAELDVDRLIFALPRVQPAADLRTRIFSSPEFLELTRTLSQQGYSSGDDSLLEAPDVLADDVLPLEDEPQTNGHHPQFAVLRPNGQAGRVGSNGHSRVNVPTRRRAGRVNWPRVTRQLAVAAAVLVLILGGTLGLKTALGGHTSSTTTRNFSLADPVPGPLAVGNRVVYLHDGRLWSAPESGPLTRTPLTGTGITVAPGWAAAAAAAPDGSHHLAYIDLKTGKLHSIQTDDANDVTLGALVPAGANLTNFWQSAEGQAILAGLAWSPDGRQLAFVADPDGSGAALWVMNADGSGARAVSGVHTAGVLPGMAAWSLDGLNLAYVLAAQGATSIWNATFDGQPVQQVAERASPQGDAGDVVRGLYWTSDTTNPTLTWSAGAPGNGPIKSLWSYRFAQAPHLTRLTSAGATFSAVDYSSQAGGTGSWLVAQVGRGLVSVHADGSEAIGLASGNILAVRWLPSGAGAIYLVAEAGPGTATLWTWTNVLGQTKIADDVALTPLPIWSPDGQQVLYVAKGQAYTAEIGGAGSALANVGSVTALSWAPDGARVSFAGAKGVEVSNPGGSAPSQVDNAGGVNGLIWTAVP